MKRDVQVEKMSSVESIRDSGGPEVKWDAYKGQEAPSRRVETYITMYPLCVLYFNITKLLWKRHSVSTILREIGCCPCQSQNIKPKRGYRWQHEKRKLPNEVDLSNMWGQGKASGRFRSKYSEMSLKHHPAFCPWIWQCHYGELIKPWYLGPSMR